MLRVLALGAVVLCAAPVGAAESFDVNALLAQPVSPGTIALLVENADRPEVQERWRAALRDAAPEVRAAAARALYAANAKDLVPALKEALAVEENIEAATEQIRALTSLAPPSDDVAILAAGKRLKDVRATAWMLLGRVRGLDALAYLPAIREIDGNEDSRRSLVRAAMRGGRVGVAQAAAAALDQNDAEAWYAVWTTVHSGGELPDALIVRSVSAVIPRIRAITYWNAAMIIDAGGKMPPVLEKAFDAAPEAALDPKATPAGWPEHEARFSYELLRRARGGKRNEDTQWARSITPGVKPWPFPGLVQQLARLFTKGERRALVQSKHLPEDIEARLDVVQWRPSGFAVAPATGRDASAAAYPAGYLSGLSQAAGCGDGVAQADVTYSAEGRPLSVRLRDADRLSAECARAARIAAASHPFALYRSWDEVDGRRAEPGPETLTLRFGASAAPASPVLTVRAGAGIKEPKKVKEVKPQYPAEARRNRLEGVVVMEAKIGTDGKVRDVRVLRGIEGLNEAAVQTVRQWEYTPTLIEGQPAEVLLTVTIGFNLPN